MTTDDAIETTERYRVLWRYADPGHGLGRRWMANPYGRTYDDRAEAEAACEQFWRAHHERWPDRRDYAVEETSRRAVKVCAAPATPTTDGEATP